MKVQENPRILVVEDEPETAEVLKQLLEVRSSAEVDIAPTLAGAREKLSSKPFDLVTLDYRLPDGFGFELLSEMTGEHPPVIIVTGHGDEEVASAAFAKGAAGYIVKNDRLAITLPQAVEKALRDFVLMRAVEAVRESESFYRTLFDESSDALFIETEDGVVEDVNRAATEMLGLPKREVVGRHASDFVPPERRGEFDEAVGLLTAGEVVEFENLRADGTLVPVEVTASEVTTRRGTRYIVSVRDISERKRAAKELENERAFIEDALDAVPDIFAISDLNGSFYKWNRSFREVTGYTDEEIDAMRSFEFMSPEDYARAMEVIQTVAETGEPRTIEANIITREGRSIPYELTGSLMKDSEGNPLGIAAIGRDMSERKRSEEALRNVIRETNERREEITALLQSTRMVLEHKDFGSAAREIFELCWRLVGSNAGYIALLDDEGAAKLLFFRPESLREELRPPVGMPLEKLRTPLFMSGRAFYENDFRGSEWASLVPAEEHIKPEDVVGRRALDFVAKQDREKAAGIMESVMDGKMVHGIELELVRKDGTSFIGEVSAGSGRGRRLLKGEWNERVVQNVLELSQIIESNVKKSVNLTDDLLELAEAGHLPWEVEEVDIGEVVQRVLEERSEEVREKKVQVRRDRDLGRVRANPTHMYLLFSNLISNAIKHNDNSKPEITIAHEPGKEAAVHIYRVCDNGSGIDPVYLDKIFLPFFSGEADRPGIGLATVEKIVNIYGGKVRAYNDDGACFEFTLFDYE